MSNKSLKIIREKELKEFKKDLNESIKFFHDLDRRTGQEIEIIKKSLKSIPPVLIPSLPTSRRFAVSSLRKYDVLYIKGPGMPHHSVVAKIDKDYVYVINVTSSQSYLTKNPIKKNRIFKNNYYVNEIKIVPRVTASLSYVFTLSDGRKEFQEHLDEVLKLYRKL